MGRPRAERRREGGRRRGANESERACALLVDAELLPPPKPLKKRGGSWFPGEKTSLGAKLPRPSSTRWAAASYRASSSASSEAAGAVVRSPGQSTASSLPRRSWLESQARSASMAEVSSCTSEARRRRRIHTY